MANRTRLWLTVAALLAGIAAVAPETAEAKQRRRKPRRFLSVQAPDRGRTPALSSEGTPSGDTRDVAGAAFDGPGRKNVIAGGAAVVLSPTRALVANAYRGLSIVDTTDTAAPRLVGSVTLDGTSDRVFVDGDTALVVSRSWSGQGGRTTVAAIDLSDESAPSVVGTVSVDGDLAAAAASGSAIVLVTATSNFGILADPSGPVGAMTGDGAAGPGAILPGDWFPWGSGTSSCRVARITIGAGGAPEIAGTVEVDGAFQRASIEGDDVALVLDRTQWWQPARDGAGTADVQGLVLADVDASAAPVVDGVSPLDGVYGVQGLDLRGGVARTSSWTYGGGLRVATWGLGAGAPSALGSIEVADWPSSVAFAGDRFVFTVTETGTGPDPEPMPMFPAYDASGRGLAEPGAPTSGPSTSLRVIDLSNAASPALGGSVDLGEGWTVGIEPVEGDAIATLSTTTKTDSTVVVRVDLDDAQSPSIAGTVSTGGAFYGLRVFDGLALLSGGSWTDDGAWAPELLPVSLADGGLAAGAPIASAAWLSSAGWSDPILAIASVDALQLIDLSDLSNPVVGDAVRLAANVTDIAILADDVAACLVTDYVGGAIEVRTVTLPAGDPLAPLGTVRVGTGDARMFQDGSMLYVLGTNWATGRGSLTVVDASDASAPRVRGSLDLASYPGQAFLTNGALVLLREASSLVEEDASGRVRPAQDPFGRAPTGWLRDEQTAVIDVIDLSDADAPRAAVRRRLRWDFAGEAILRGSTLYVPSTTWTGWADGTEQVLYGVRAVDLSNPTSPRVGRVVDVPGSLVGAADDRGEVLTASWDWDVETGSVTSSLHVCDVAQSDWRRRVIASRTLGGSPGAVVTGEEHAYVATETWDQETGESSFALETLGLADLTVTSSQSRAGGAWGGTIAGGRLFLRTWGWSGAIDAYDLTNAASPSFRSSSTVEGVGTTIRVAGGRAYVPAGYRGIVSFE